LDLISLKWYLNSSTFCFIIGQLGIYIERYLGGGAEFKNNINRITVDIPLIPPPLPSSPPPSPPQFARNHPETSPSPLLRDVGWFFTAACALATPPHSQDPPVPLPSPEGCGPVVSCSPAITLGQPSPPRPLTTTTTTDPVQVIDDDGSNRQRRQETTTTARINHDEWENG